MRFCPAQHRRGLRSRPTLVGSGALLAPRNCVLRPVDQSWAGISSVHEFVELYDASNFSELLSQQHNATGQMGKRYPLPSRGNTPGRAAGLHPSGLEEEAVAYQGAGPGVDQDGGATAVANGQAGAVARTAADASSEVAQTAEAQVRDIAGEARRRARDLVGEAGTQRVSRPASRRAAWFKDCWPSAKNWRVWPSRAISAVSAPEPRARWPSGP